MKPLDRAISICGSQAELSKRLGLFPQYVNNWRRRGVPAERCIAIEEATGGKVTRYDLRPDVFGQSPGEAN